MEYSSDYFNWQKNIGAFGGHANLFKVKDFITKDDKVIDFGCGGGYLLANIICKEKIGVEINDVARNQAAVNGIPTVKYSSEIPDGWADVIISNHALEHVENPLQELKTLFLKIRTGGKIVFVLPHEVKNRYIPGDVNQHLYTWSPMNAGNLFTRAGFSVMRVETIKHAWPPYYPAVRKLCGEKLFDVICRIYAIIFSNEYQVRVIGVKK